MNKNCTKTRRDKVIVVSQKGRRAEFVNPDEAQYAVTEIDGCLISNETCCDYLVRKLGFASVLVELKGRHVDHACRQLFATIEKPSVRALLEEKKGFLIVCSKYPRIDTFVIKAKREAARRYRAGFKVCCNGKGLELEKIASISEK